jgi:ribose 5-phosphate isomerase B
MYKIAIGCDHAAFGEKEDLKEYLSQGGYKVYDVGTDSLDSVDYPIYGHKVADLVVNKIVDKGIIICGSGIGISIAANKVKGARAALCVTSMHAEMSRKHNDANILALGSRMTKYDLMKEIIDVFLCTEFEGGRHLTRINMIEL